MTKLEHPPTAPPPTEAWAREDLDRLAAAGLRRHLEPLESPQGPVVTVAGRALLNFSSNDYLSLAADPRVVAAAKAALDAHGAGAGASRLIVGDSTAHRALERAAAAWLGTEDALVFNSGYAANVGALAALLGPDDAVFSDALNHASLIDGCRLARAAVHVYPHRDLAALEALLTASGARRRLVVTDSVFSMDGDRAPLGELRALCDRHGAALYVDEAHALGVLGPQGRGLCAELEVVADLRLGTLGKALGGFGAFLACSGAVRELLFQRARSLVFSTSLPPHVCAAATRAIALVQEDPAPQARLGRNVDAFARGLESLGLPSHRDSAIFSVLVGAPGAAVERSARLRARGVLAKAIRPPTVPEGTSRLRFALCAGHQPAHLEAALEALEATVA